MVKVDKHPNVISLVGVCEHENAMYLLSEYAPQGNLLEFLRRSRVVGDSNGTYTNISPTQLVRFAHDVAQGMCYLSEKQVNI